MKITIGSLAFTATLYDNHSVQALKKILPITLTMNELNGNGQMWERTRTDGQE